MVNLIELIFLREMKIMAKFCPKCGIKLNDDAIFCGSCGYKIPENDANNTIVQTENNIHQETSAEKY